MTECGRFCGQGGDHLADETLADEGSSLLSQHEQTEAIMQDPTSPAPNGALSTGDILGSQGRTHSLQMRWGGPPLQC